MKTTPMPAVSAVSILAATLACLALAGCGMFGSSSKRGPAVYSDSSTESDTPRWLTPYRIDIGQGNYVSESMAAQLKSGMTKDQVRAVLGTPLLIDPFRKDRWDYVFDIKRGDGYKERRRFSVFFQNDLLANWGGDPLPQEAGEGVLPSRPAERILPTRPAR